MHVTRPLRSAGLTMMFLAAATAASAIVAHRAAAESPVFTCMEAVATIVGTPGDDVLWGTEADDVIVGLEGDDYIDAGGGADLICGDPGSDELVSYDEVSGNDKIDAGQDSDPYDLCRIDVSDEVRNCDTTTGPAS